MRYLPDAPVGPVPSVFAATRHAMSLAMTAPFALPARLLRLLDDVTALVADVQGSAARVRALLDEVEAIPGRVTSTLDDVDAIVAEVRPVPGRVHALVGEVETAVAGVQPVLAALESAQGLLTELTALDPALARDAAGLIRSVPPLLEQVNEQVLPALGALEGLVPVVAKLSDTVDNLNSEVGDVGTLLGGIPGASLLLRRGERDGRQRALFPGSSS